MKPRAHKVIPGLVMAAASAVPMVTTVSILAHVTSGENKSVVAVAQAPTTAPTPTSKASTHVTKTAIPKLKPTATATTRTIAGPVVTDQFGGVQATITVKGTKITNVAISAPQDNPRSAGINAQAVPLLQSETLQAQSANVNTISGATLTSEAYIQSLQSALKSAQIA